MSTPHSPPNLAEEYAAALDWWRLAGVDHDFADDATDWMAQAQTSEPPKSPDSQQPAPRIPAATEQAKKIEPVAAILPKDSAPRDLSAFHQWWMEDPALDAQGPRGRIAPRGQGAAKLMVLVVDPEAQDSDHLLSGPQGQLLEGILKASGLDASELYFASILPRHTPMANGHDLVTKGLAEVLHLHIQLAAPRNILGFGSNTLPLLAHGMPEELVNETGSLHEINHDNRTTPLFVAESLEGLMGSPSLKARFWRRWVKWTERLD